VRGFWDGEEEARAIAEDVEDLQRKGHKLDEISILVRAGYQTREFEDRFLTIGVPYRVIGGPRFYERREIRDAIAYLRVVSQPEDGMAFERIVNVPKRGLGEVTVQAMHKVARAAQSALLQAAQELLGTDELRAQARTSLGNLLENFARWRAMKDQLPLPELVETVLDESGYTEMWHHDKSIDAPGRLDNLRELVHSVGEYESLTDFLDHVSLVMDHDTGPDQDMVNIMTLHAAKGLEFDTVFLPGWEEGLFPNQRSLDEGGTTALEEERRLAHVGMTRARKMLRISFAQSRRTFAEWQSAIPSRFIDELPIESVEVAAEASVWGQAYSRNDDETYGEPVEKPWDSPGRRRMRRRNNRGVTRDGQLIETRAELVDFDERPTGTFSEGDRVFHQKFGYGQIESIDGNRLEIQFDKAGSKKVIDSFVRPA
jgi:DNA helicase-2/ATP-dependent DNA helicase PcrA